jgi:hypothetical protein
MTRRATPFGEVMTPADRGDVFAGDFIHHSSAAT